LRALIAVAKNDWRRFWRYPLSVVSQIFMPVTWLVPAYFTSQAFSVNGEAHGFAGYTGTTDFMSFILLGSFLNNFINAVFWGMGYSLKNDMDSGVLESNWMTPVPRSTLLIGRTFTNMVITTITSTCIVLLGWIFFGFHLTGDVVLAFLSVLPMLLGLYGFGFAFASIVLLLRDSNTLVDVSSYLVTLFSGSNFPVTALPRWLLPVAWALPITYGYDAFRGWLLGTRTLLPLHVETGLMVIFMVLMLWTGSIVFRWLERRVRMRGTLGQH
jgi:ABC-2 type transport system permease protein